MKSWTDYQGPLRECEVIAYDGDKYVTVIVDGHKRDDISWRHVFEEPGQHIRYATLAKLPTFIKP